MSNGFFIGGSSGGGDSEVTLIYVNGELAKKVDKVTGKQLSTNDYTTAEKTKLAGVATGANNYTLPSTLPASMITGLPTKLSQLTNDTNFINGAYDNTTSGLAATTIKGAIDELKALFDTLSV